MIKDRGDSEFLFLKKQLARIPGVSHGCLIILWDWWNMYLFDIILRC